MFVLPFLLGIAFLGPPATVTAVFPHQVARAAHVTHAAPRLVWVDPVPAKPVSRAAALSL